MGGAPALYYVSHWPELIDQQVNKNFLCEFKNGRYEGYSMGDENFEVLRDLANS